jgi:hypothetical protein
VPASDGGPEYQHPHVGGNNVALMRAILLLTAATTLAVGLSACSRDSGSSLPRPSKPFCEAAHRYDVRVEKRVGIGEQIRLVQQMADHAPQDIARDTAVFLDALERRRDGDTSVVDNPKIEDAVNNVNRRAAQGCEFYRSNTGGGI